jgi:hypothetical protein
MVTQKDELSDAPKRVRRPRTMKEFLAREQAVHQARREAFARSLAAAATEETGKDDPGRFLEQSLARRVSLGRGLGD